MPPMRAAPADEVVAVGQQLRHQAGVLGVAAHEAVALMVLIALLDLPVLREVVEAHDLVAEIEQVLDQVAADEAGGAGDQHTQGGCGGRCGPGFRHVVVSCGSRQPQMSMARVPAGSANPR